MAEELSRTLTPPDGTVQGLVEVPKVRDPTAFYWVSIWFPAWKRLTRPLSCLPIRFYYDAGFSHLNELSLGGISEVNRDVIRLRVFDRFNSPTFINLKFDWFMVDPV